MATKYENKTEPKARKKNMDNMVDSMERSPVRGTRRETNSSQAEQNETRSQQRPASATPYRESKDQTKASVGPKQAMLNALSNAAIPAISNSPISDELREYLDYNAQVKRADMDKLIDQYAQRAEAQSNGWDTYSLPKNFVNSDDGFPDYKNVRSERQYGAPRETIAPGSIDVNRDTVYRVGADDPYGYYSQAQLNNAMSGPDANAIYQATHEQGDRWTYGSNYPSVGTYGETPQEYNNRIRSEGYLPNTGRQLSMPVYGDGAYVAGADAWTNPIYDDLLPAGVGSAHGIPYEYLNAQGKLQRDLIDEVENRRRQIYGY